MKKKRLLSLLVALAMCVSLLPQAAWAEDAGTAGEPTIEAPADPADEPTDPADEPADPADEPADPADEPDPAILAVQAQIDALPDAESVTAADYDAVQEAYDAYDALTPAQQAQITGAEAFEALFLWFSAQAEPIDTVAVPEGTVARVVAGGTTKDCKTLEEAITAVPSYDPRSEDVQTVYVNLLKDYELSQPLTFTNTEQGKIRAFILNLNGHNLTGDITIGSDSTEGAVVHILGNSATNVVGSIAGTVSLAANGRNNKIYIRSGYFLEIEITQKDANDFTLQDITAPQVELTAIEGGTVDLTQTRAENVSAAAKTSPYNPISYLDENGVRQTTTDYTIYGGTGALAANQTYVLFDNNTITPKSVGGGAKLILMDGVSGIYSSDSEIQLGSNVGVYVQNLSSISGTMQLDGGTPQTTQGMKPDENDWLAICDHKGAGSTGCSKIDGDSAQHNVTCGECNSVIRTEAHTANTYTQNGDTHTPVCKCGAEMAQENHAYTNFPNDDGKTHRKKCVCGAEQEGAANDPHSYNQTTGNCNDCGAAIVTKAEIAGSETYHTDFQSALEAAARKTATLTLLADTPAGELTIGEAAEQITADPTNLTIELNGKFLKHTLTMQSGSVTIRGSADGSQIQRLHMNGGTLTIESGAMTAMNVGGGSAKIKGGSFRTIEITDGSTQTLTGMLAENCDYISTETGKKITPTDSEKTIGNVMVVDSTHTHTLGTGGKCGTCGQTIVAEATADGATSYDISLDGIGAKINGKTAGVNLLEDAYGDISVSAGTITLDLKGRTMNGRLEVRGGNVTVNANGGKITGAVDLPTAEPGSFAGYLTLNGGTYSGDLTKAEGTLIINGGTFTGTVDLGSAGTVRITGGTFAKLQAEKDLKNYLAENRAFVEAENPSKGVPNPGMSVNDVKVIEHYEHTVANGSCTICGKSLAASIKNGSKTQYFETLENALENVGDGQTLTLENGITFTRDISLSGKSITLDLNGKKIQGSGNINIASGASLTLKGTEESEIAVPINVNGTLNVAEAVVLQGVSVTGHIAVDADAKFVSLSITGGTAALKSGTFATLSIGTSETLKEKSFLGTDRAYYTTKWLTDADLSVHSLSDVSVKEIPLKSADISLSRTPAEAGFGDVITLTLEYKGTKSPTYQWYTVSGETATPLEGKTQNTLTVMPAVGSYIYRCAVTVEGYTLHRDISVTVNPKTLTADMITVAPLTFQPNTTTGAGTQQDAAVTVKVNGTTLTENTDYTLSGDLQGTEAGDYSLTVTGKGNYTGTITKAWKISPAAISNVSVTVKDKTYDGTTAAELDTVSFQAGGHTISLDALLYLNATVEFADANVGTGKAVSYSLPLGTNYTYNNSDTLTGKATADIEKATVTAPSNLNLAVQNKNEKTYTVALAEALPALASGNYGTVEYSLKANTVETAYCDAPALDETSGVLTLAVKNVDTDAVKALGEIIVTVKSTNYEDFDMTVAVSSTNKISLTGAPTLSKSALTYGEALSAIALSGTMQEAGDATKAVAGVFSWESPDTKPNAGSLDAKWNFVPNDADTYAEASGTITIPVNQAKPSGTPTYTKITAADKTLADAALAIGSITPAGNIAWDDAPTTVVVQGTAYGWTFTPADSDNYTTLTGSVVLWAKPASSGGSGSSGGGGSSKPTTTTTTTTTTTENDGSVTKTETKTDGTVIETTTKTDGTVTETETKTDGTVTETTTKADGSVSITETKADGSSTTRITDAAGSFGTVSVDASGNTTAQAQISSEAIAAAANNGTAITAPIQVDAGKSSADAPAVSIRLGTEQEVQVEIPVNEVSSGTVAVIVHEDGTEEVVKATKQTENGIQISVSGNVQVKIVDAAKEFDDSKVHWAHEAIKYVSARGILSGTEPTKFGVSEPMTRGMILTALARLEGVDTSGGDTWYAVGVNWAKEKGFSDGTNPNAPVTREQLVTILYRYAGAPQVEGEADFTDAQDVSAYAKQAMLWAVQNGIMSGRAPQAPAERAQVATILMNFLQL